MMPLIYWHLNSLGPKSVPRDTLRFLRNHFHHNAGNNLLLAGELLELLRLFDAHGVHALPVKGPLLAATVYGNVALREAGDLDILVRRQDVLEAKSLLLSRGYHPLRERTAREEEALLRSHWEYQFVRDDGQVMVELHWRITPHWEVLPAPRPSPLDPDRLWERRQVVSLLGGHVAGPSPEDHLLILCVHGAKHLWRRLIWITDVAELIGAFPDLDWKQLTARASAMDGGRMVLLGLLLARDLLTARLPAVIEQRIETDAAVSSLARQVCAWLFRADAPGLAEECAFHVRLRKEWQNRLPYLCHYAGAFFRRVVTPSAADRATVRLPRPVSCLYYLIRPLRLAIQYGVWRRKREEKAPRAAK